MSDDSQVDVPEAFVGLFIERGRARPSAPRAEIAARHEFCEDLAQLLAETAPARRFDLGVTEADVLERMHRGLTQPGPPEQPVSPAEAWWVVQRLAEILGWPAPDIAAPA